MEEEHNGMFVSFLLIANISQNGAKTNNLNVIEL